MQNEPARNLKKFKWFFIILTTIPILCYLIMSIDSRQETNSKKIEAVEKPSPLRPPSPSLSLPEKVSEEKPKTEKPLPPEQAKLKKAPPPEQAKLKKPVKGKRLVKMLSRELNFFDDAKLKELKRSLISKREVDPSEFALEFIKSENKKTCDFGYKLMTAICTERPENFKPNEFYKAFAKKGISSSKYLSEIIEKTDDDFCREWACELSVDIYYNNAPEGNSRKNKISEFKKREQKIYSFIKEVLSSEEQLKKTEKERGRLSDIIINQWGKESRIPLKMQALIATLDMMHYDINTKDNSLVCSINAQKIINTYNFNYNILGWVNGKKMELPPLPEEVRLKKFADAIFKDKYKDTYLWLPKDQGGFTSDELEIAVETADRKTMRRMISGFRKIIVAILKQKILIGQGNHELQLLRHFNHKIWGKDGFDWDNHFLEIINNSGRKIILNLGSKTGSKPNRTFTITGRSKFIWFLPEGEYILSEPGNISKSLYKQLSLKDQNITIDIK